MFTRSASRGLALVSAAGLAAVPASMIASPSLAAADCGTGTEITDGVCEMAYTTAGDYTFEVPSSVSQISAVIVGAGSGAAYDVSPGYGFAGGGGAVEFVDAVALTAPVAITVGAGSAASDNAIPDPGGDSSVNADVAAGGFINWVDAYTSIGTSGNGNVGGQCDWNNPVFLGASGGGAGGEGESSNVSPCAGGVGMTASEAAAGSSLFPALLGEPEYGIGGAYVVAVAGATETRAPGQGGDTSEWVPGPGNSGDGADGAVILRWLAPSLPDTGVNVQPWMWGTGIAVAAAGALLASGLLRTRRPGRHSA